ncbi:tripartite tricarboxylate transporter permease [Deinococcus aerophilus]|uniref:DUF112 domain-containing protein n=1 Tax=Deinococcus aerophilus TaxID=522488 RepID=A0ABQ2GWH1_9DEIO|nr:tripartite tricarboxylate transporter permease [Deinococcus aerophilus]GGM17100.1 hypothetical protein GCM10010841_26720 [Deinococcus aerophilus]
MITLAIALVLGIILGTVAGLMPGLHSNTVAASLVGIALGLPDEWRLPATVAIAAAGAANIFWDLIPTLFLGIPGSPIQAMLPTHRLVMEGRGGEALRLSARATVFGVLCAMAISTLLLHTSLASSFENQLEGVLFPLMLIATIILLITEKRRVAAVTLFTLAGLFGVIALGKPIVPGGSDGAFGVLLPALTGMFGMPGLLSGLSGAATLRPRQDPDAPDLMPLRNVIAVGSLGTVLGALSGFLPGMGSANIAALGDTARRPSEGTSEDRRYIALISGLQAADMVLGVTAWYLIDKARSGISVSISLIADPADVDGRRAILFAIILSAVVSYFALRLTWRGTVRTIERFDQRGLNFALACALILLVAMTTGWGGLLILAIGTLLGAAAQAAGIRQAQLMGFLLIPVLLYLSGNQAWIVSSLALDARLSVPLPTSTTQILGFLGTTGVMGVVAYQAWMVATRR